MHKLTFYNLGNADCCKIDLDCGKKILFDYANTRNEDDEGDLRCDLPKKLRDDLEKENRDYFDIVAFTHLDRDHFTGFSDFFYLEYAKKYQSDDRIKIDVLWVPAALITESYPDEGEARILQREARYRFRNDKGIRVFSRPERLKKWCDKNDINIENRKHLITDAGQLAPEVSLENDSAEFFVHSPFALRQNENDIEDRNSDTLVMQLTLQVGTVKTKALLLADTPHETIADIVNITKNKNNEDRLEWDIAKLPHHCSFLSIGPDKCANKTEPVDEVDWLYSEQSQWGAICISTSKPIPKKGSEEDEDPQPPHRQAAAFYKDAIAGSNGQFVATMEHPNTTSPKPIVINVDYDKATLLKTALSSGYIASSQPAPRAGS